jgi:hypothetical protein
LLNVDEPISEPWDGVLIDAGYGIDKVNPAYTQRYRGLSNADLRAEHEVLIVAMKPGRRKRVRIGDHRGQQRFF